MTGSFLSERLARIKPSATLVVAAKAMQLQSQGIPVLNLGLGEPDFDTPEVVCEGAMAAMRRGETRYTNVDGTPALKRAVAAMFQKDYGLHYEADQISVGTGAKQVLYNALMATVDAGDEVIIPTPCWVSYVDMVALCEGVPCLVTCPIEQGFKMTPSQLERSITPRTKWLLLNSPSNPTGAVYSEEELRALGEVLLRHPHVWVLSDDIYAKIVYEPARFATMAAVVPALASRCLTLNGVSKAYAMTGWRIGYAGGPLELIKAMRILQSQSTSNPSSISQAAALAALEADEATFLPGWINAFRERRDAVVQALNAVPGLRCPTPDGAFYVFPSCIGLFGKVTPSGQALANSNDVAAYLLEAAEVAVVPGVAFGMDECFRISYATSMEILMKACAQIAKAVAALK